MVHYSSESQKMTQATIKHILDNHSIAYRCVGLWTKVKDDDNEWLDVTSWTVGQIKTWLNY
jgi:hypothetical protein